jgi:hypothetical protein
MNKDLNIRYVFHRFFQEHPDAATERDDAKLQIPIISRLVATHYTYEALIVAQAKMNPLALRQDQLQVEIDQIVDRRTGLEADDRWLEGLKKISALMQGLEAIDRPAEQRAQVERAADALQRVNEWSHNANELPPKKKEVLDRSLRLLNQLAEAPPSPSREKMRGEVRSQGEKLGAEINRLETDIARRKVDQAKDDKRLEDLKDTLGLLSGLEAGSVREIEKRLRRVDAIIEGKPLDTGGLKSRITGFNVDRLYTNQKVKDLVDNAEVEQSDKRRAMPVNVFFSPVKRYFRITASVYAWNTAVLVVASILLLGTLFALLKRQLRPRGV